MELEIESKITADELYHFLLHHAYSSVWGFTGILISVCALLAFGQLCFSGGDIFSRVCLLATALLFLVIQPFRLYLQSRRLMESDPGYRMPIQYTFHQAGITLKQEEDQAFYTWSQVEKVISTKKLVAVYVNKKRVFKLSRRDIGEHYDELKEIFYSCAVDALVKLK